MNRSQKESAKSRAQSMSDEPTAPTKPEIDDGVEKIPTPIVHPNAKSQSNSQFE